MTTSLKQRMVGAIFILSLGVILLPVIFDKPKAESDILAKGIPEVPALPDVSEVAQINYVFDEPAIETSAPAPAVVAIAEPVVEPVAPQPPAQKPINIQAKAKASLAEAAQSQWTIQLGAFSSEENANVLMQKLSQQGFQPYLRKVANDSLVRVYVSPGVPREQAVSLTTKLDTELGLKGIVVRYFQ